MKRRINSAVLMLVAAVLLALPAMPLSAAAQTQLRPGMNLFSMRDDVEIGRRSASEVERKYRTYPNSRVESIGRRLASSSSQPGLPWRFRVIDMPGINAFAMPGGYVYVTSGLLRSVHNDNELAGVLAHEITHVTLRHGTNQASKAMLAQMPFQLLSGLMGNGAGAALTRMGIGFGLNSLFLRYSRSAESQADIGAVQLMRRAGYNPYGLESFLSTLKGSGGGSFFSDHPSPANRVQRVDQEIRMLGSRR